MRKFGYRLKSVTVDYQYIYYESNENQIHTENI